MKIMTSNVTARLSFPLIVPLRLGLTNSFIIRGARAILVDTCYPGNGNKILRKLEENSIKFNDLSLILLTHGHVDHYGSAAEIRSSTGTPIAIHKADAGYLERGIDYLGNPMGFTGWMMKSLLGRKCEVRTKALTPDIVFDGETDLEEFGIDGKVILTPGHTAGSTSVILSGGHALVGDLLMGGFLYRKSPRYPMFVSDMQQWRDSLDKIIKLSPKDIYPSHGGPFSLESVRRFSMKTRP